MAFEPKDNTASLFQNDRKESANHPDGKGTALIGGVEYWVSSWNKMTQEGKPWRSMSFTPKDNQPSHKYREPEPAPYRKPSQDGARSRQVAPQRDEFDDGSSIPF